MANDLINGGLDHIKIFTDTVEKYLDKSKKVAIFTHSSPDADAVSSMMAVDFLFRKKYSIESDLLYTGCLSHPQQKAIKTLLEPDLFLLDEYQYTADKYCLNILVDTCVSNAGIGKNLVNFNLVIDHHPPNGHTGCPVINLRAGSCAGTIYDLIKGLKIQFNENEDYDCKVATAIMIGVFSDTDQFVSDDTTAYEHTAFGDLFQFRIPSAWKQIVRYKLPKSWVLAKSSAAKDAYYDEGGEFAIYPMGLLTSSEKDLLAITADELLSLSSTAFTFAVIDGNTIEGCLRTINPSIMIPEICKALGSQKGGSGWGKNWKGRYYFPLGGSSIDPLEEDDMKTKTWELIKERETRRIKKYMKK